MTDGFGGPEPADGQEYHTVEPAENQAEVVEVNEVAVTQIETSQKLSTAPTSSSTAASGTGGAPLHMHMSDTKCIESARHDEREVTPSSGEDEPIYMLGTKL